jgi:hypothetical protein
VTPAVKYVVRLAGNHAGEPYTVALDTPGVDAVLISSRAIYLAYGCDRQLHYVGKVSRTNRSAVARRLREHMRLSRRKRFAWRTLWIVPLDEVVTEREIAELERTAIRRFRPPANVQNANGP